MFKSTKFCSGGPSCYALPGLPRAPFFTPITPCQPTSPTFYVQGIQGSTLEFFPTQHVHKNTFQLFRKHDGASIESPLAAFLTLENTPNKDQIC